MVNISLPHFDQCRNWIKKRRERGFTWESILTATRGDDEKLAEFLIYMIENEFWPEELDCSLWKKIVQSEEDVEKRAEEVSIRHHSAMLIDSSEDSDVIVPVAEKSSWQLYKTHLLAGGFSEIAVDNIERATIGLLKRLNSNTADSEPIKGLVIGNVQSGKTANMAALMAMAADWGWNMFIVLSGTIENLRKQTQSRLQRDLNQPGNLVWTGLDHLSLRSPIGQRTQDLYFDEDTNIRYFTVCLKNPSRLRNLLKWLQADPNKQRQMKILVIDDEADQAGINTAKLESNERKTINKLIVNLVENKTFDSKDTIAKYRAMNYISYTATPYANFLNESTPESLYPRNFIRTLESSDEYFGPQQLFGAELSEEFDGLDVIRMITDEDMENIRKIHEMEPAILPNSLKEAFCWFLCSVSSMRVQGYKKPISMLIHTSQRQIHHDQLTETLLEWINTHSQDEILEECRVLWTEETTRFSKEAFFEQYSCYGRSRDEVKDYPSFNEIIEGIKLLLQKITHIHLNEEEQQMQYHEGIHLCIDNCSYNNVTSDGDFVRLAYPEPTMNPYPSPAPAFIVIGGSTLSRGLTIEGLVSTYFCRNVKQADTLMQMGRWFGYRKNYELYPRIWLTDEIKEKFEFLSDLDLELRNDLYQYMVGGKNPSEYGPRVKNSPKASWLQVTAKNRMQRAVPIEMDFTGTSTQTRLYPDDASKLAANLKLARDFVDSLTGGVISEAGNAVVYRGVDFAHIEENLLSKYIAASRGHVFNEMSAFCDWIRQVTTDGNLTKWNVVIAGKGDVNDPTRDTEVSWTTTAGVIGKVRRTRRPTDPIHKVIDIGVLRDAKDCVADVERAKLSPESRKLVEMGASMSTRYQQIRVEAGLDKTPQLLIYIVDKDSKSKGGALRKDLDAPVDLVGLCINVPGAASGNSLSKALTIQIETQVQSNTDEE